MDGVDRSPHTGSLFGEPIAWRENDAHHVESAPGHRPAVALRAIRAMKLHVIALDYDGTIATEGRLEPEVAAAVAEVRKDGRSVVLVTGRILDDLRCQAGSLRAFDAVVAEEGAVIAFPQSGSSRALGARPPAVLRERLHARGIPFEAGQCLLECEAVFAPQVLELVRELELPLVIHFNRGRMMILPQAISKATGLREALRSLRLSVHNAIGIGDAENDHELLAACEVGVAVAWGSSALKGAADLVLEGEGPCSVAAYLREIARSAELPPPSGRRRLLLGRHPDGTQADMQVRGRNVLIAGDPSSGKSWLAGLLAEQLVLQGYSLCVIDPEGDYGELGSLPGVRVLGGEDTLPSAREVARFFAYPDSSAVIDLSRTPQAQKPAYVASLMDVLADLRRSSGFPHRIVIDEAHYFLHDRERVAQLTRGLQGCTLVTYRVSDLPSELLRATEAVFVTRETDPHEARVLHGMCAATETEEHWQRTLAGLEIDEAALLPGAHESGRVLRRFRIAPRLTRHVRHEHKYLDVPLAEHLAFRFGFQDRSGGRTARSMRDFVEILECTRVAHIDGHLRRGDFSRWVEDVFHDGPLAAQFRELEELYRIGNLPDVNGALVRAVRERYRAPSEHAEPVATT